MGGGSAILGSIPLSSPSSSSLDRVTPSLSSSKVGSFANPLGSYESYDSFSLSSPVHGTKKMTLLLKAPSLHEVDQATRDLIHMQSFPHKASTSTEIADCWTQQNEKTDLVIKERDNVYQALQLLQQTEVQGIVKSIALDPAVWEAVCNNEKVKELIANGDALTDAGNVSLNTNASDQDLTGKQSRNNGFNIFGIAYKHVSGAFSWVMDSIVDIVGGMFGFVDNGLFGKKGGDPVGKGVASCMMLSVAVLLVVMLKRAA